MDNVVDILKKVGAVITDSHFVYTSGKHGSVYVNKDAVYPHTEETSKIGQLFAEKFKDVDIDGSTSKGWRVFVEDWGHVDNHHTAICCISPSYLWHGK